MPELMWDGKYSANGQIVAPSRVSLPFQTVETVNQSTQQRQIALAASQAGHSPAWRNRLIWGDKRYVLPSLLAEFAGKVDLIYIDPPFKTGDSFAFKSTVHPDFEDVPGEGSQGRATSALSMDYQPNLIEQRAYSDTWGGGLDTYLKWMFENLVILRELLTSSGSIYVHCDDTASHYIKALADEVFGYENFRNEITWKRTGAHNSAKRFGPVHDVILYYTVNPHYCWNIVHEPQNEYIEQRYTYTDEQGRRFYPVSLIARGTRTGSSGAPWRGIDVTSRGNHWRYTVERLEKLDEAGDIYWPSRGSMPRLKMYAEDAPGKLLQDWWDNIPAINSQSKERVGYDTQKPEALLERIIKTSSSEGDLVLDCFVGSGTTAVVAEKLGRRWVAADMGRFAISTTRKRLLEIQDVKPFYVQNLGRYERQAWQNADLEKDYREFILQLYLAEAVNGYRWLHGAKAGRMVHVGGVDSPVALDDVKRVVEELDTVIGTGPGAPTGKRVDILGWDFGLEVDTDARQLARDAGVNIRLLRIPREIMDQRAVAAGDVQFFELASLSIETRVDPEDRKAVLTLDDFVMPPDGVPDEVREKVTHWSQWIDYWAVDWDYHGDTFNNQWQSYRTRQEPQLRRSTFTQYEKHGPRTIVVKVIDVLGNDTTRRLDIMV